LRREEFGWGTNNEAEYLALLAGLRALYEHLRHARRSPEEVDLVIRGDSRLVLEQLRGTWRTKDARMRKLREAAELLLRPLGKVRLIHQERWRSVRALGH
jgi:probable phosphoglycerate mutase